MEEELPRVVLAANDCVMNRAVGSSLELETESNLWEQSGQIPGVQDHQHLAGLQEYLAGSDQDRRRALSYIPVHRPAAIFSGS